MNPNKDPDYQIEYNKFASEFRVTEVSAEEVGVMVMKMATFFGIYNLKFGDATRKLAAVKASLQSQTDPTTGKPMSTSKAEIMADASPEGQVYISLKTDVQTIEQFINALKSLQRGVQQEYSHS